MSFAHGPLHSPLLPVGPANGDRRRAIAVEIREYWALPPHQGTSARLRLSRGAPPYGPRTKESLMRLRMIPGVLIAVTMVAATFTAAAPAIAKKKGGPVVVA